MELDTIPYTKLVSVVSSLLKRAFHFLQDQKGVFGYPTYYMSEKFTLKNDTV